MNNKANRKYHVIRWLLIGSLLIQSGFTVAPIEVDNMDLVTQEVEQEELDWLIQAINNHQLNQIIEQNSIPVEEVVVEEELTEEDGFVYGYDDYNQQVLSYCKVMPLYEKLEIKNLFDHDKLELEYQYE